MNHCISPAKSVLGVFPLQGRRTNFQNTGVIPTIAPEYNHWLPGIKSRKHTNIQHIQAYSDFFGRRLCQQDQGPSATWPPLGAAAPNCKRCICFRA